MVLCHFQVPGTKAAALYLDVLSKKLRSCKKKKKKKGRKQAANKNVASLRVAFRGC